MIYLLLALVIINVVLAYYAVRVLNQLRNFRLNDQTYMYQPQEHLRKGRRRRRRRKATGDGQ